MKFIPSKMIKYRKIRFATSPSRKIIRCNYCSRFRLLLLIIVCGTLLCVAFLNIDFYLAADDQSDNLSWFQKHRNLSAFVQSDEVTYRLSPDEMIECNYFPDDVSIVYFVTSSPRNRLQRRIVRETWGRLIRPRPIFLTGYVETLEDMDFLYNESKIYGDIIIENFLDTYYNLTLKTAFIFKNFLRLCPNALYLMKTDDDVFINTTKIESIVSNVIRTADEQVWPIIGRKYLPYKPHRFHYSKWYLPYWMYNETYLPSYVSGTAYLIPGKFVEKILQDSLQVPMLFLEDVYFTGLVAGQTSRIPLENNPQFRDEKPIILDHYCSYRNLATMHHLSTDEMIKAWSNLYDDKGKNCQTIGYKILEFLFGL